LAEAVLSHSPTIIDNGEPGLTACPVESDFDVGCPSGDAVINQVGYSRLQAIAE
jgi:hypothetical protein